MTKPSSPRTDKTRCKLEQNICQSAPRHELSSEDEKRNREKREAIQTAKEILHNHQSRQSFDPNRYKSRYDHRKRYGHPEDHCGDECEA
jgi:hypothetical protein